MVSRFGRCIVLGLRHGSTDRRHLGSRHLRDRLAGFDRPAALRMGFGHSWPSRAIVGPARSATRPAAAWFGRLERSVPVQVDGWLRCPCQFHMRNALANQAFDGGD
jgi:hypothetical protein